MPKAFDRSYVVTDNGNGSFTIQSVAYDGSGGDPILDDGDALGDPLTIGEDIEETNGSNPPFNAGTFYGYVGTNAAGGTLINVTSGTDSLAGNIVFYTEAVFAINDVVSFTSGTTVFCFAEGSQIATQAGETNVEDLTTGDLVRTADGRMVPVKWIGRQTMNGLFQGARIQLVRIRAGAFGDGLPHSDLTVTADHGMVLDGLVINAGALVNGGSISFVPMAELPDSFTVYHIETEAHDVILANGAPSETFIDYAGRQAFDNYAEYVELYGADRIIPEMPQPRISSARMLPQEIRARLAGEGAVTARDVQMCA